MKLFISYSDGDLQLAQKVAKEIENYAEPMFWESNKLPGDGDWSSIFRWIDQCEIVLVLISRKVVKRGLSIGQEIGYAKKSEKIIIPFVASGVPRDSLGCLNGLTHIFYNEKSPELALRELHESIFRQTKKIENDKLMAFLAVGAVALILLSAGSD